MIDNQRFSYLLNALASARAKLAQAKEVEVTKIGDHLHDVDYHIRCAEASAKAIEEKILEAKRTIGNVG